MPDLNYIPTVAGVRISEPQGSEYLTLRLAARAVVAMGERMPELAAEDLRLAARAEIFEPYRIRRFAFQAEWVMVNVLKSPFGIGADPSMPTNRRAYCIRHKKPRHEVCIDNSRSLRSPTWITFSFRAILVPSS